jgi:DNA invertase Pin-like site-specific DNA recombinase
MRYFVQVIHTEQEINMKTAVAYLRISKNEARSVSLEYQKAEVERTALAHGYTLISIECDTGISGKSMANRPGFQTVLNMLNRKNDIQAYICFKSDRTSRNGVESIMFESLLASKNIAYISATEGIIGDSNEDPLLPFLRGGLNQRERMIISMRTKKALNLKRERGERLGGGIRYGQTVQNGQVVQNEAEVAIVNRTRELKAMGYSTRAIAQILNSEGFKPRRGQAFSQTQIVRILKAA